MKKFFGALLVLTFVLSSAVLAFAAEGGNPARDMSLIAKVFDYGQDVIAAVIDLGEGHTINTASLTPDNFAVSAVNSFGAEAVYDGPRNVTGVYANNEAAVVTGKAKPAQGRYIILELQHGYDSGDASYNNGANALSSSKQLDLQYRVEVHGVNDAVNGVHVRKSDVLNEYLTQLIVDEFEHNVTADGLNYYLYVPELAGGEKVPMVMWLHGGGERAYKMDENGPEIFDGSPIRQNQGGLGWIEAALVNPKYKAIVIVPQSNSDCSWSWNGIGDASTLYRDDERIDKMLKEVIASLDGHVDTDRIYVSGCSNGGAQTLSSVIYANATEGAVKFAAAMPICPSLSYVQRTNNRRKMTDAEAALIKDTPMWFFNSETDQTVDYLYTAGTARHLYGLGGNIRLTVYEKLEGSGLHGRGEYTGHHSWTMVLGNNHAGVEYVDYPKPFDWLFEQSLSN